MFLYIPGGEQLDFNDSITSFLWFSFTSPTPHTLNTWSNPNHHLLNWPKTSTDSTCTKQGIRYQYFLRQIIYIVVKLSDIMMKFYEMLHQTPNSPETRPILVQIPWSLRRVTWPWCYPDSFPLTIQVGVKFHQIHPGRNRGHYMTPTQTMHCTI